MHPPLIASLRTLIDKPDNLDRDALFAVLTDTKGARVLADLAPTGTLAQIAASLNIGWWWNCDGWGRQTNELVHLITEPHCSVSVTEQMITAWSRIPSAVGVLRERTDDLIAWAEGRLLPEVYADLATLLGPSDAAARLLMQSLYSTGIGRTLRRWSMAIDPGDPTAWQAMISPKLRAALREKANVSKAFPAWGGDDAVYSVVVLPEIVNDLIDGWSPDHPSIRRRIGWLEHHIPSEPYITELARVASIGGSDALAEAVCARLGNEPSSIPDIAFHVPWNRLHPQIQTVIDETMRRSSDDRWARTWACAIGQEPLVPDTTINAEILLWRIDPERWNNRDPSIRAALVSSIIPPSHCYGWGVHPDLVAGEGSIPDGGEFRFWNPNVPSSDLRAWDYAALLWWEGTRQDVRAMIALLMTLPPDRRMRFEQIIDGRLGGRSETTAQPPWEWTTWAALPATDRQQCLRDWLHGLWEDNNLLQAVPLWHMRNDGLATVAFMMSEELGIDDESIAALLAQVPSLQRNMTDVGSPLPFPDDLNPARRAQIERLPLSPNAKAYAAWCLGGIEYGAAVGADLIALHPDVAVALAPILNADQQKAVAASPIAQKWDGGTQQRWVAACAGAKEQTTPRIQRRRT